MRDSPGDLAAEMDERLAQAFERARNESDLDWKEWQQKTGLPRQTLDRVIRRKQRLTFGKAVAVAAAAGAPSISHFVGELDPSMNPARPDPRLPEALERVASIRTAVNGLGQLLGEPAPAVTPLARDEVRSSLRILPAAGVADADEPREIHETEVPVVAWAAAGAGEIEQVETGELASVNNTIARLVQAGRGFVARVSGSSMEPDFKNGSLVYFRYLGMAEEKSVKAGNVVYVLMDGSPRIKVYKFDRGRGGARENVRFVSINQDRSTHPTIYARAGAYRIIGVASTKITSLENEDFLSKTEGE